MGVPKFFRYISERYPCLSELAREQCIPHFDNLYLDMNGIIHNCSHPDDGNIHFHITEQEMFQDIVNYIDKLFFLIKPRKVFFMAVDGVAPRAKMNQQRSRRYRSAKEAELLLNKAMSRGEVVNNIRFDSNCITPGTEFMCRLHEVLKRFIKSKLNSDAMWQKCRVILSGHDSPGEGEHKIMDYIRYIKSQEGYDPNTRHCLYGLDADLIILGLVTHELRFVVLREEVKFGRKASKTAVEETRFFLLHLGLLREYLALEFNDLRKLDPSFDIDRLIDDWILMGFLVGNDFIPHLPCLHISSNALPLLYKTYIKIYPSLGGNINEKGKLNLERLEHYFVALTEVELNIFRENYVDLKYFQTKQIRDDEAFGIDVNDITKEKADNDLADLIENSKKLFDEDDDDGSSYEDKNILSEFKNYKRNYYLKKLRQSDMSSEQKRDQAVGYVTALQWILDYYYYGVSSWEWYYPHHYAPFISDLRDFKHHSIKFDMGKPFQPFEQLLAVLPPASKDLLPTAYRSLMTSPNSEIKHFYPDDFETDLNGKKQDWEAVVLIPFIDQNLLLQAMKTREQDLTASERKRNQHGPMLQFDYFAVTKFSVKGTDQVRCEEKLFWPKDTAFSLERSAWRANIDPLDFCPGFPTMKHLKYDFEVKMLRVKVFDQPSRNESLLLLPENQPNFKDVYFVAQKFLNQKVFIGWPHLIKAKVIAVSNKEKIIDQNGVKDMDSRIFQLNCKSIQEHLSGRMAVQFKDYSVMVHANTITGTTFFCDNQGRVTVKDVWSNITTFYPAQGIVPGVDFENTQSDVQKKIENIFPINSTIFFLGKPYFGSEGIVLNPLLFYECGRLKINITVLPEPDFSEARDIQSQLDSDYVSSHQTSVLLGLSLKCLSRLTGTVLVVLGPKRVDISDSHAKINIGLQLKFPKQQEERAGYARRINNQWCYSSKAIALIKSYCLRYPPVVEFLSKSSDRCEFCFESDLFPRNMGERRVEEILSWIKSQDQNSAERITCGSKTVGKETVKMLLESIENLKTLPVKTVKLQVKPYLLLKPDIKLPEALEPRQAKLFDRIVIVRSTYMVPLGSKGTVVGIFPVSDPNPVRLECLRKVENFLEILFDKQLTNGNEIHGIASKRVCKVAESSVLLIHDLDCNHTEHIENKNAQSSFEFSKKPPKIKHHYIEEESGSVTYLSRKAVANANKSDENIENFWLPSMKEKVTNYTLESPKGVHLYSVPQTQSYIYCENLHSQKAPGECRTSTQVLKNLLGLGENHFTTTRLSQSPKKYLDLNCSLQKNNINSHESIAEIQNNIESGMNYEYITSDTFGVSRNPDYPLPNISVVTSTASQNIDGSLHAHDNASSRKLLEACKYKRKTELDELQKHSNDIKPYEVTHNSGNKEVSHESDTSALEMPSTQSSKGRVEGSKIVSIPLAKTHNKCKKPPRTPKIGAKFDYAI